MKFQLRNICFSIKDMDYFLNGLKISKVIFLNVCGKYMKMCVPDLSLIFKP